MIRRVVFYGKVKSLWDEAEAKASVNSAFSRREQTRSQSIYPWAGGSESKISWTPEPVYVAKCSDDLWIGAID